MAEIGTLIVALLALVSAGGAWVARERRRQFQRGQNTERQAVAVAMVQRERELAENERETYRAHVDRVTEIRATEERLATDDPAPADVRALIERSKARRRARRGLAWLLALGLGLGLQRPAMAEVRTASIAHALTTPLERALWLVAVAEEARADEAESQVLKLKDDLLKARALPEAPIQAPCDSADEGASGWVWVIVAAGGLALGLVAGRFIWEGREIK